MSIRTLIEGLVLASRLVFTDPLAMALMEQGAAYSRCLLSGERGTDASSCVSNSRSFSSADLNDLGCSSRMESLSQSRVRYVSPTMAR